MGSALLPGVLGHHLSAAGHGHDALAAHARAVTLPAPARAGPQVADDARLESLQARVLPTLGFSLAYLGHPEAGPAAVAEGWRWRPACRTCARS